jgi:hypothetical protein
MSDVRRAAVLRTSALKATGLNIGPETLRHILRFSSVKFLGNIKIDRLSNNQPYLFTSITFICGHELFKTASFNTSFFFSNPPLYPSLQRILFCAHSLKLLDRLPTLIPLSSLLHQTLSSNFQNSSWIRCT